MSVKITLFWPLNESYNPNLSIIYQEKMLKKAGYSVNLIFSNLIFSNDNFNVPKEFADDPKKALKQLIVFVSKSSPDYLVIGSWRKHLPFLNRFIPQFKAESSKTKIIVTGHHPTFIPDKVLELIPDIDFIVRGEAEFYIAEIIEELETGTSLDKIQGISYIDDFQIRNNPDRKHKDNIDNLPFLDFKEISGFLPNRFEVRSSRGCIGKCTFCSYPSFFNKIRFHSPDYVISQFQHIKNLYSPDYIHFIDEMFLNNPSHSLSIARKIGKKFNGLKWGAMLRADTITERVIEKLSANGFSEAVLGVESVIPKELEFLGKTKNPDRYLNHVHSSIQILSRHIDTLEIGLIEGIPESGDKELKIISKFIEDIRTRYGSKFKFLRFALGKLVVYPGTRLWEKYMNGEITLVLQEKVPINNYHQYFISPIIHIPYAVSWLYDAKHSNNGTAISGSN